eukprot:15472366-Alexandrium_andersonii.AAC.1
MSQDAALQRLAVRVLRFGILACRRSSALLRQFAVCVSGFRGAFRLRFGVPIAFRLRSAFQRFVFWNFCASTFWR